MCTYRISITVHVLYHHVEPAFSSFFHLVNCSIPKCVIKDNENIITLRFITFHAAFLAATSEALTNPKRSILTKQKKTAESTEIKEKKISTN